MQVKSLFEEFDRLQLIHGDKGLNAIYGCGETNNPKLCLIFMNPTSRNVSSNKNWTGLRAPWIGTKNIWKMLHQLGFISKEIADKIATQKPSDWDKKFAEEVYQEVCKNSLYITNLSKATQIDARHLPNSSFKNYIKLLREEINHINPKIIITFGNQVSSIFLDKNIKISEYRKKGESINIEGKEFKVFPVYYPVGQGMRNMHTAKEDIDWIINHNSN